jgi:hypothetical protein
MDRKRGRAASEFARSFGKKIGATKEAIVARHE